VELRRHDVMMQLVIRVPWKLLGSWTRFTRSAASWLIVEGNNRHELSGVSLCEFDGDSLELL
jgi:hypothetical protein